MAYFVTGATGFIGKRLLEQLLDKRQGKVFVLVRESSLERLEDLINPARIHQIKEEFLTKQTIAKQRQQSNKLFDILDSEEEGCAACFI